MNGRITVGTAEALAEVEKLIEYYRGQGARDPAHPANRTYATLKAIASDLRARLPAAPGEAQRELQRALDDLERSKDGASFSDGCAQNVAMQIRSRWPVVRQALERFEKAVTA